MLGVVWAVEQCHLYLYGPEFTIATDHKPLLEQSKANVSPHREMEADTHALQLPAYLPIRKDTENPADFMSRHPGIAKREECNIAEDYVNYIRNRAIPKAMTLQEVKSETEKDISLQALIKAVETDQWSDPKVQEYKKVKDELLVYKGTILRGNRIVVLNTLRDRAVELAHVGHQGIVKTKRLIREKVWFPGVDKMAKEKVDSCLSCQAATTGNAQRLELLQITPLWRLSHGCHRRIQPFSRSGKCQVHFSQIHHSEARCNFRTIRDS